MLPVFGVASFVLWLHGLHTAPGDSRVHLWLVGACLVLLVHRVRHRRARRRAATVVSSGPEGHR